MDWKAYLNDSVANIKSLRSAQPEMAKGFGALHDAAIVDGALDVKTKELIALAIGINQQCLDCIGFHVKAAIRAGATREEVAEMVSVVVAMGGGPKMMYGSKAMEAYDQLSA